jgi:hypothetical protein
LGLQAGKLQSNLLRDGKLVGAHNAVHGLCVQQTVLDGISRDLLRPAEQTLAEDKLGIASAERRRGALLGLAAHCLQNVR